ncbi:hypothetical protein [Sporosarcina ureae]|uniref:hypothetical protein n=1 Tax=Sporosarcina ureae TaxID=1571 RepID=UPI0009DC80B3|nr:hypothetical protein [Sporosarcina ureae]ARF17452.1 hypothetical protein SporoP17a_09280 [Sporosarcina ureae]
MFKVAIIGPLVSVKRIENETDDFTSRLSFTPYIYESAIETIDIVKTQYDTYDYFLFSGPIPYELALRTGLDPCKFFSIVLLETGFYKALLNLTNQVRKPIERLSIDIVNTSNVVDVSLSQLNVPVKNVFVKTFDAAIDYWSLYEHHVQLWEENKVEAVLTCYPDIMVALQEKGIPTDWISTTKLATRHALETIDNHAEISFLKRSQIGVCIIHIDNLLYEDPSKLSYDIQFTTLKMNEELLLLSREMNGSFVNFREGQYMIFSSRGEIIDTFSVLLDTIERLEHTWSREINSGIGFGDSAIKAEMHARKALQLTQRDPDTIILIDHEGKVLDLPSEYHEKNSVYHEKNLLNRLNEEHINISLFDKVREVIRRKKWSTFTAKELAFELKMSDRNAQRTLLLLTTAGIMQQQGEEKAISKGRPSKLYKLDDTFL